MVFTKIGHLLRNPSTLDRQPKVLTALQIKSLFTETAIEVFPDLPKDLFDKVRAANFKNGTLTIVCPHLVGVELKLGAGGLIDAVNKKFGKRVVRQLRFRVG